MTLNNDIPKPQGIIPVCWPYVKVLSSTLGLRYVINPRNGKPNKWTHSIQVELICAISSLLLIQHFCIQLYKNAIKVASYKWYQNTIRIFDLLPVVGELVSSLGPYIAFGPYAPIFELYAAFLACQEAYLKTPDLGSTYSKVIDCGKF